MSDKIKLQHLQRKAIVYVRQSTPQQVLEHRESTQRQYALVDRAAALGWDRDQIHVIDEDQGLSGQSITGRVGFQRLLEEIGLDRVGLILGLEMSRFAKSCKDWHELPEDVSNVAEPTRRPTCSMRCPRACSQSEERHARDLASRPNER